MISLFGLLIIPLMLFLAVAFAAVVYRGACSILNALSGRQPVPVSADPFSGDAPKTMPAAPTKDVSNPYAAPTVSTPVATSLVATAVPMPSFPKAMGIVLLGGIAQFLMNLFFELVITQIAGNAAILIIGMIVRLILGWLILAVIGQGLLPTTFGKGALVALIYNLLMIVVAVVIALVLFLGVGTIRMTGMVLIY